MVQMDERVVYTIEEVAALLGISRSSGFNGARTGELPTIRIGRRLLVPRVALERMLDQAGQPHDTLSV